MKTKPCLNCGQTIIKPQNESLKNWENRHKYCSRSCMAIYTKAGLKTRFSKERHYIPSTAIKKGQHLSPSTQFNKGTAPWNKNTKGLMNTWNKGKRFPKVTGEKHWNWKGGISKLSFLIRNLPEMKNWIQSVFKKHNWTCIECGKKGDINAHHIKSFKLIIEENKISSIQEALDCSELWDTSNGQTLCIGCHRKTDTYLKGQTFKPKEESEKPYKYSLEERLEIVRLRNTGLSYNKVSDISGMSKRQVMRVCKRGY